MADFDPTQTCALYNQHRDRWQLETDVAEMTLDVLRAGTYMPRFSAEEAEGDYTYRKNMAAPLDLCRDAIRIRRDAIWRTAPKREVSKGSTYAGMIEQILEDCDDEGTPLDTFMRRAYWRRCVTGVDITCQMTSAPEDIEIRSEKDVRDNGLRPYFSMFSPLERYDWAANASGGLLWARYSLGRDVPIDEQNAADNAEKFITLTTEGWRLWEVRYDDAAEKRVTLLNEGQHPLGKPPVVKLYHEESTKPGQVCVPISLISRPAVVAAVMLNLKSQADADLIASVTRWFATGVDPTNLPDSFGPATLISFPSPDSGISVLQGDVGHIREKREWLVLYIQEVMRLLKFWGGVGETETTTGSGVKLAMARTDLDNELRATASELEYAELEMMRQAAVLRYGKPITPAEAADVLGYSVQYEKDFVLEPVGEMIANIREFVNGCEWVVDEVPEVVREMLRQLTNNLMREGSPQADLAYQQIEEAKFTGVTEESTGNDVTLDGPKE